MVLFSDIIGPLRFLLLFPRHQGSCSAYPLLANRRVLRNPADPSSPCHPENMNKVKLTKIIYS